MNTLRSNWKTFIQKFLGVLGVFLILVLNLGPFFSYLTFPEKAEAANWGSATIIDSTGDVGEQNSIAVDSSGNVHISYHDVTNGSLKYAYYNGSTWTTLIVDDGAGILDVGRGTSIALDSSGNPHISYSIYDSDDGSSSLWYAYYNGSAWETTVLDNIDGPYKTAIAIDSSDNPHIVFSYSYGVKYIKYNGSSWSSSQTIESGANLVYIGRNPKLVLDSSNNPHVAYRNIITTGVKGLIYNYYDGSSWNKTIVDPLGGSDSGNSIQLDSSGNPHISYYYYQNTSNRYLKYASYDGANWSTETVDSSGWVGISNSLVFDHSDYPMIAYWDRDNYYLKFASYNGTSWSSSTLDSINQVGSEAQIARHPNNDSIYISYYDDTNNDLKYISRVDTTPPSSIITYPANDAYYSSGSLPANFSGTATDTNSSVASVQIEIKRNSDDKYWTGSTWSATETWLTATGTTSWTYSTANLLSNYQDNQTDNDNVTYQVKSKATDTYNNIETAGLGNAFTFRYPWKKYTSNPVIDDADVGYPRVIYNQDESIYKMWAETSAGIKYTTSSNGTTWDTLQDVTGDENVHEPTIIKDGATYKMWFNAVTYTGYKTSSDGITWIDGPDVGNGAGKVVYNTTYAWDDDRITPFVIKDGSTYKMYYNANEGAGNFYIAYATSADGTTWTEPDNFDYINDDDGDGNNNLLLKQGSSGWDSYQLGEALYSVHVLKNSNETYEMWYGGNVDGSTYKVGYVTSNDGIVWTKSEFSPIMSDGSDGEWDNTGILYPAVTEDGSTYRMWYTNNWSGKIGYATYTPSSFDTTPPTIISVSSDKTNGSYTIGEVIDIDVTFSEEVTSTGDVTVTLETGDTDRTCTFYISNSTTGTCNYTVQAGDTSSDLNSTISGTIKDTSANENLMTNFTPTTNLAANKALVIDAVAPSAVSSLAVAITNQTSATLTWTAPGDDLDAGTATTYDVRYSTSTITDANWSSATAATGEPSPSVAGSSETMTISSLTAGTTYYFAIKTSDEVPNTSELSNVTNENTWQSHVINEAGDILSPAYNSITLDSNNYPHIAHFDGSDFAFKYTYYDGSSWQTTTLESVGIFSGDYTSIALDSNDHPHIIYLDGFNNILTYTYYDGSNWQTSIVGPYGFASGQPALALDSNDRPHIIYYDTGDGDLEYMYYDDSNWQTSTVDNNVGDEYSSLALDSSNHAHVSYYDDSSDDLKYAYYDGSSWNSETVDSDGDVGSYNSIKVDSNNYPHISYYDDTNNSLKYAYYDGSSWNTETVDSSGDLGYISLALDSNDKPRISYAYSNGVDLVLKIAAYDGSNWFTAEVDTNTYVGLYTSIALDSNDHAHVSYYDFNNFKLKYASNDLTIGDLVAPIGISDLTCDRTSSTSATLTWTAPGDDIDADTTTIYDVRYSTSTITDDNWASATQATDEPSPSVAGTLETMTISGLTTGTTYYFAIKSSDEVPNISSLSNVANNNWELSTIDSTGIVGGWTSIKADSLDHLHISYFDETDDKLKYAYYDGSTWTIETVDSTGRVGIESSLALDSNNHPHISYFDDTNDDLKYTYYDGSSWQTETVDSGGSVGRYTSLAIDSSDLPHISYYDNTNENLKYAYYDGSSWQTSTLDSSGWIGIYTSIALDSDDHAHISYHDNDEGDLKYITNSSGAWVKTIVDSTGGVGEYTSIALDSSGLPRISYYDSTNDDLKYAYYNGSSWQTETVDSTGDVGKYTSVDFDSNDHVHISYFDDTNNGLKYAYYNGSTWQMSGVDLAGAVGEYNSLTLNSENKPQISYYDNSNGDLKYANYVAAINDTTPPTSVVTDLSTYYNASGFPSTISGTASDATGIASVDLRISKTVSGTTYYWKESTTEWTTTETWNTTTGTTSWSFLTTNLAADLADAVQYTVNSRATDSSSNSNVETDITDDDSQESFTYDTTLPTITNVTSDTSNGYYNEGDTIDIDVTFSEAVISTGNVTVTLETGDTDQTCTFTVSNSTTGTCNYTVQAGDTSSDLDVKTVSGTINDQASNTMTNFTPTTNLADNKAIVVDTTNPTSTPTMNSYYNSSTWDDLIVGTASNGTAGVASVAITIQRSSDSKYWDGDSWEDSATWLSTTYLLGTWSYSFSSVTDNTYTVQSRATDNAGNIQTSLGSDTFTYDATAPSSTPTMNDFYNSVNWPGSIFGTASDATSDVASVEVKIQRLNDSYYWTGSTWQVDDPGWLGATGTTSWSYTLSSGNLTNAVAYTVTSRATDNAGNIESTGTDTFMYHNMNWTQYRINPLPGSSGMTSVTVIKDDSEATNKYKMWYSLNWEIYYAYSDNGIAWQAGNPDGNGTNQPIISGSEGEWDKWLIEPWVVKDGSTYKMWYAGTDDSIPDLKIGYATSSDGITWTRYASNPIMDVGTSGDWDDRSIRKPTVIKDGSTYKMWYAGTQGANTSYDVGYATSSDGIAWTKSGSNPVLQRGGGGTWDASNVWGMSVYQRGTVFEMYYTGNGATNQLGHAYSTDGTTWTKYSSNPVITNGADTTWNDEGVFETSIYLDNGVYKMWYSGNDGANTYLGYTTIDAAADSIEPNSNVVIVSSYYGPITWNSTMSIIGLATDAWGIEKVELTIQRDSDSYYWTGSTWLEDETWVNASDYSGNGYLIWNYPMNSSNFDDTVTYTVTSKATDGSGTVSGNVETSLSSDSFTWDETNPSTSLTQLGGSSPASYYNTDLFSSVSGTASDATSGLYEVYLSLKRSSDNKYWDHSTLDWEDDQSWDDATGTTSWTYSTIPDELLDSIRSVDDNITYSIYTAAIDNVGNNIDLSSISETAFIYDNTGPTAGTVNDGTGSDQDYTSSTSQLSANWSGFADTVSGIASYEYSIGTSVGATNVTSWTSNGSVTSVTKTGLTLINGQTYYINVRAIDNAGNTGSVASSDGITVDTNYPTSTPIMNDYYNASSWPDQISGTASAGVGVFQVEIKIQRSSDSKYWDGDSWEIGASWLLATGTNSWNYDLEVVNLNDGATYTISSRATDTLSRLQDPPNIDTFTYDTSSPISGLISINTGATYANSTTVNLTLSATDATSGMYQMRFSNDNSNWSSWESYSTSKAGWTLTSSDGTKIVYAQYKDNAGNTTSSDITDSIIYDGTNPAAISNVYDGTDATDDIWTNSSTQLSSNWTASTDATSGIQKYQYAIGTTAGAIDIVSWTDNDTNFVTKTGTYVNGQTYYFTVRAVDGAGNTGIATNSNGITIDTTPPTSTVSVGNYYNSSPVTISGTSSDASSDISSVAITIQRSSDNYYWTDSVWQSGINWLSATYDSGNWTYSFTGPVDGLTYSIQSRTTDNAANVQTSYGTDTFTYDITNPTAPASVNDGTSTDIDYTTSTTQLSANWTASTDVTSEILKYQYAIGTFAGATDVVSWTDNSTSASVTKTGLSLSNGLTYYFTVRAVDGAGNTGGVTNSDGIMVDNSGPTAPGAPADSGIYSNNTSQTWTWTAATDPESGVAGYYISIGTSAGATDIVNNLDVGNVLTYTRSSLSDEVIYYAKVRAYDAAGNAGSYSGNSNGITIDTTAPLSDPQLSRTYYSSSNWPGSISVSLSDVTSGISVAGIAINRNSDGYGWCSGTWTVSTTCYTDYSNPGSSFSYTFSSSNLTTGESYTVDTYARDNAANIETPHTQETFTYDNSAPSTPTVNDGTGADVDSVESLTTLSANWTSSTDSQSGITKYEYAIGTTSGGTNVVSWTSVGTSLSVTRSNLALSIGTTYYFSVRATNGAGTVGTAGNSDGITVVDQTPPTVTLSSHPSSPTNDNTPTFQGSATDSMGYIAFMRYRVDSGEWIGISTPSDGTYNELTEEFNVTLSTLSEGSHTVDFRATDASSNTSTTYASSTFTVDTTAPDSPTITSPTSGSIISDQTPTIIGTAEADSTVILYITQTGKEYSVSADSNGNWSYNIPDTLEYSTYTLQAKAQDLAGNISSSTSISFTIKEDETTKTETETTSTTTTEEKQEEQKEVKKPQLTITIDNVDIVKDKESQKETVTTLPNTKVGIGVKPLQDKPVKSITGTFEEAQIEFTDSDGNGIYDAEVLSPTQKGTYTIPAIITYEDGTTEEVVVEVLVDPYGYVYEKTARGELRLVGAKVTLYVWKEGSWQVWDSSAYNQNNPQTTNQQGEYGFMVSEGKYYLTAQKGDYQNYRSSELVVNQGKPINLNIELEKKGFIAAIGRAINDFRSTLEAMAKNDSAKTAQQSVNYSAISVIVLLPALSWILNLPLLFPFGRLISFFLLLLGHRGPKKPWGIVYDSEANQPIPLAVVRLFDYEKNKLIETHSTDKDGRFGFLVEPGKYYIQIIKKNYTYSSGGKEENRAKVIEVKKQEMINFNAVMNPDLGVLGKRLNIVSQIYNIVNLIRIPLLIVGGIMAVAFSIGDPSIFNLVVLSLYILVGISEVVGKLIHAKTFGKITDILNGSALNLAIIRLFNQQNGKLVATRVSNQKGAYNILVSEGNYHLAITRQNYQQYQGKPEHYEKSAVINKNFRLMPFKK